MPEKLSNDGAGRQATVGDLLRPRRRCGTGGSVNRVRQPASRPPEGIYGLPGGRGRCGRRSRPLTSPYGETGGGLGRGPASCSASDVTSAQRSNRERPPRSGDRPHGGEQADDRPAGQPPLRDRPLDRVLDDPRRAD